jgi:hypothetical protein
MNHPADALNYPHRNHHSYDDDKHYAIRRVR